MKCKPFLVMGASDRTKLKRFKNKLPEYDAWLNQLAVICERHFGDLFFIPDKGVYVDFALAYGRAAGNERVVAVVPNSEEWIIERAYELGFTRVKRLQRGEGWNYLNTHITSIASYALYLGYSAGSILEMMASKYLNTYEGYQTRFFIDTRSITQKLPPELEEDIRYKNYFKNNSDLEILLDKYVK